MYEREPDQETYSERRNISPAQYAYLDYLLTMRESQIAELDAENKWLKYDQLTGVYVAKVIRVELDRRIEQASENGETFALIFGDVDNMKELNSRFGYYDGGDAILSAVGRSCRKDDLVGRAGGDELWWIADLKPREEYYANKVARLVDPSPEHLAGLMAKSFEKRANDEIKKLKLGLQVRFSVGFALFNSGDTAGDLITRANQDMTEKKERNKEVQSSRNNHPSGRKS